MECLFNFYTMSFYRRFVFDLVGYGNDHFMLDETLSILFPTPGGSLL